MHSLQLQVEEVTVWHKHYIRRTGSKKKCIQTEWFLVDQMHHKVFKAKCGISNRGETEAFRTGSKPKLNPAAGLSMCMMALKFSALSHIQTSLYTGCLPSLSPSLSSSTSSLESIACKLIMVSGINRAAMTSFLAPLIPARSR